MGCEVEEASNGGHRDGRATLAGEEGRRWSLGVAWAASKGEIPAVMKIGEAKYCVGQVVRHRFFPFRGVIFDVDPIFANTDEWYEAIPEEIRPSKEQPFYHLLAENDETEYVAYVSEQNLLPDDSGEPVRHPQVRDLFGSFEKGLYRSRGVPN